MQQWLRDLVSPVKFWTYHSAHLEFNLCKVKLMMADLRFVVTSIFSFTILTLQKAKRVAITFAFSRNEPPNIERGGTCALDCATTCPIQKRFRLEYNMFVNPRCSCSGCDMWACEGQWTYFSWTFLSVRIFPRRSGYDVMVLLWTWSEVVKVRVWSLNGTARGKVMTFMNKFMIPCTNSKLIYM